MKPTLFVFRSLVCALVVALVAGSALQNAQASDPGRFRQLPPPTLDSAFSGDLGSLDPAGNDYNVDAIWNLFLGLTRMVNDGTFSRVEPALATHWEVSADGLTWTFYLRNDVNWIRYDPVTEMTEIVRPVIAEDMVFAIKRLCDPRLESYTGTMIASVVAGCNRVIGTSIEAATDEWVYGETTRVYAPDDSTVIIELQFPAAYFLTMSTTFSMVAVPQEIIALYGDDWTAPGKIVTNGPFMFKEYMPGVKAVFVRNPSLPADLYGSDGNIEVVNFINLTDSFFVAYLNNQIDRAGIPEAERPAILADPAYQDQIIWFMTSAVFYFGFSYDKPPFDNVHVRRAFSAIIDRRLFIDQLHDGLDYPMIYFTPPGIVHAPPINEIGLGFAPDVAVEELALAGYPNCEGFPETTIMMYQGAGGWGAFWASKMEQYLGCDSDLFHVDEVEFQSMIELLGQGSSEARPGLWILGWGPDYNDANNFVGDVLHCEIADYMRRPCTAVDDMIDQARRETDPQVRTALYAQIEEAFFGRDGEFPIAPLFLMQSNALVKPWYTGPHQTFGLWTEYSIDMEAKLAARGQ